MVSTLARDVSLFSNEVSDEIYPINVEEPRTVQSTNIIGINVNIVD